MRKSSLNIKKMSFFEFLLDIWICSICLWIIMYIFVFFLFNFEFLKYFSDCLRLYLFLYIVSCILLEFYSMFLFYNINVLFPKRSWIFLFLFTFRFILLMSFYFEYVCMWHIYCCVCESLCEFDCFFFSGDLCWTIVLVLIVWHLSLS